MTTREQPAPSTPTERLGARPGTSRRRRWLTWLVAAYVVLIFLTWIWMSTGGDRDWHATMFLFGPRWLCALPLLLLVPAALFWRRWLLAPLAVAGLVILFPIMGLTLHFPNPEAPYRLRVFTCNVNQLRFPVEHLAEVIAKLDPDVVALQEVPYNAPPLNWPADWQVVQFDKFIVASPYPLERREYMVRPVQHTKPIVVRFLVKMPEQEVQFFNLHLSTPRDGLSAALDSRTGINPGGIGTLESNIRMRSDESLEAAVWIQKFQGPKILAGDFNTPADSTIFRLAWNWLDNAFSTTGLGFGFTKLTGRGALTYGTRIDHVLYSPPWQCVRAWVGPDIGSDHLPLVADFE